MRGFVSAILIVTAALLITGVIINTLAHSEYPPDHPLYSAQRFAEDVVKYFDKNFERSLVKKRMREAEYLSKKYGLNKTKEFIEKEGLPFKEFKNLTNTIKNNILIILNTTSEKISLNDTGILVFVDNYTRRHLGNYLDVWMNDVESEGLDVLLFTGSWTSPLEIKSVLSQYSDIRGVVFIGFIPPCMDGTDDCYFGDYFLGRITPYVKGEEGMRLLRNYFERNHELRTSGNHSWEGFALVVGEDIVDEGDDTVFQENYTVPEHEKYGNLFPEKVSVFWIPALCKNKSFKSCSASVFSSLESAFSNHFFVHVDIHGSPYDQYLARSKDGIDVRFHSSDPYFAMWMDSPVYWLSSCSTGRFFEEGEFQDYIAGHYLFDGKSFVVIAPLIDMPGLHPEDIDTKSYIASSLTEFYSLVTRGVRVGDAWYATIFSPFHIRAYNCVEVDNVCDSNATRYALIEDLFGDPTLRFFPEEYKVNLTFDIPVLEETSLKELFDECSEIWTLMKNCSENDSFACVEDIESPSFYEFIYITVHTNKSPVLVRVYEKFENAVLCYADYCRPLRSVRTYVFEDKLVRDGETIEIPVSIVVDCKDLEAISSDEQTISDFFRKFERGEIIFRILVVSYDSEHPVHTLELKLPVVE